MGLLDVLKDKFSNYDKFNNSEIISMMFQYTRERAPWYSLHVMKDPIYFPYEATDMEIANALKSILTVPFALSIGRQSDNNKNIYSIVVSRVFV
jgi:pSer/pThr/pTyr-binding forkhead associated (FHA) protein